MGRLFGTDGVRGQANEALTAELALDVVRRRRARAGRDRGVQRALPPLAVVGRDPRASGEFLEAAVVAGLASAGVNVVRLGVLPTPGVAYLTGSTRRRSRRDAVGQPQPDARQRDQVLRPRRHQARRRRSRTRSRPGWARPGPGRPAPAWAGSATTRRWSRPTSPTSSPASANPVSLDGLKVVVDCANGAAYLAGAGGVRGAGRRGHPDPRQPGRHQHQRQLRVDPHGLAALGRASSIGADIGIALDGDADRCLAVDATGEVVDGDQILAILAVAMREAGRLKDDTVVATVMSNLGLRARHARRPGSPSSRPAWATATCWRR